MKKKTTKGKSNNIITINPDGMALIFKAIQRDDYGWAGHGEFPVAQYIHLLASSGLVEIDLSTIDRAGQKTSLTQEDLFAFREEILDILEANPALEVKPTPLGKFYLDHARNDPREDCCNHRGFPLGPNAQAFIEYTNARKHRVDIIPFAVFRRSLIHLVDDRLRYNPEFLVDALSRLNGSTIWYSFILKNDELIHMRVNGLSNFERAQLAETLDDVEYVAKILCEQTDEELTPLPSGDMGCVS